MIPIEQQFRDACKAAGEEFSDVQEVMHQLLDKQVIYRAQSEAERRRYDRFIRCESVIKNYLSVLGISVFHDHESGYVAAFPPKTRTPDNEIEDEGESPTLLRLKLSAWQKILIIALRHEYEEGLRNGNLLEDDIVEVIESEFIILLNKAFKRTDASRSVLKEHFKDLKRLRLIAIPSGFEEENDSIIQIRPMILRFTFDNLYETLSQSKIDQDDNAEAGNAH
jgi:hypothetical protein